MWGGGGAPKMMHLPSHSPPPLPPPPATLRPVKTADHGEMKLTHRNQIQKMFNFYEESVRVPLIYSNPALWPTARLVRRAGVPRRLRPHSGHPAGRAAWPGYRGRLAGRVVREQRHPRPVQDEIVFLFDDFQYGQATYFGTPVPPNLIRSIVEDRWKFAEYYDPTGRQPSQFECYDLLTDPDEVDNLAWPSRAPLTPYQAPRKTGWPPSWPKSSPASWCRGWG